MDTMNNTEMQSQTEIMRRALARRIRETGGKLVVVKAEPSCPWCKETALELNQGVLCINDRCQMIWVG